MRFIALLFSFTYSLHAQFLFQIFPDTVIKWNYYDGDEFNKGKVNTDKWHIGFPWGKALTTQETYVVDSNVTFESGIAQFAIKNQNRLIRVNPWEVDTNYLKKEKIDLVDGNKFQFKYTGGLLWSKKIFKYGYFETKFRASEGQGIWPAFWLYGANPNNEIDFFELKGEKENQIHVDVHCPEKCSDYKRGPFGYRKSWGHWIKTDGKFKEGFNILGGEWTPTYIKWYLNGQLIAFSDHNFDLGMNLIIGTGIARNGGPFKPGPDKNTPFPNIFMVDYVRVYKTDTLVNRTALKSILCKSHDTLAKNSNDLTVKKASSKLKNNPDKNGKYEKCFTVSVQQISHETISVCALGLSESDSLEIIIKDNSSEIISQRKIDQNIQYEVLLTENKPLSIHIGAGTQKIDERLILQ
jgi:beta-glucanase (GH16 family)